MMKNIDILVAFETEINQLDSEITKPATDDSLYWLNQYVSKFVKTRFNGDVAHGTGVEQTEKRRTDLEKLFTQMTWNTSEGIIAVDNQQPSYGAYRVYYPNDFLYALNEDVVITDKNGEHEMNTCVFECTQDSFMYRVNNSLTDFHYRFHRARPIRIRMTSDLVNSDEEGTPSITGCTLLTEKKEGEETYKIKSYTLGYIRQPKRISLVEPYETYDEFDDSTMYEIIKGAAQMYLENNKDERYKTITAEVLSQE